jgi:hypothetical protein
MNSRKKVNGGTPFMKQETEMKIQRESLTHKWREMFRRRRRMHDPMLVLNMSSFNFTDGWSRTFNPVKIHENGT